MGATGVERASTLAGKLQDSRGLHGQVLEIVHEIALALPASLTKSDQI